MVFDTIEISFSSQRIGLEPFEKSELELVELELGAENAVWVWGFGPASFEFRLFRSNLPSRAPAASGARSFVLNRFSIISGALS